MRRAAASALFIFVTVVSLATASCQPVEPLDAEQPSRANGR
jgi:hypothetical protein